jgi:hypothetical protein
LLGDHNEEYFSEEFPIFYLDPDGSSPIEYALEKNQIRSVNQMINYVVNYQNSWVYSNLFHKIMIPMILKGGVKLQPLFESEVIIWNYETPTWPSAHKDTSERLNPYNESLF